MIARFALWSLADSAASLAEIRGLLPRDGNLVWFSDEGGDRLGAFGVFPDAEAAAEPFPDELRGLIGKDPDVVELFDVE